MQRILLASAAACLTAFAASAQDPVNVGILVGFTGPIESLAPGMAASAELAFKEANESGLMPVTLNPVRGDTTCGNTDLATPVADRMVTSDKVVAIMGSDCSGVTIAILNNIAVPNGVVMVSPSATSPALTTIEDNGFFFRTAPSDARQGEVLADVAKAHGITDIAVTFSNSDYGKGLAESFEAAFKALGGTISISAPHDDGKGDYSAEVGALQASGSDALAVLGYVDRGGRGIVQASLDQDAFETFLFGDGMHGQSIIDAIGPDLNGKVIGVVPGSESEGRQIFADLATAARFDPSTTYTGESYDAAALIALAIAAGGSADRTSIRDHVMDVANAPGELIKPGEIAKAIQILKDGGDVDYVGATDVEMIGPGEAGGTYREFNIDNDIINYVATH